MSACGRIEEGIEFNCNNIPKPGTKNELRLINREDWDAATLTYDTENPNIITSIDLPTGKFAYLFKGFNNSINPTHNFTRGAYIGSFTHIVNFIAFDVSPKAQLVVKDLANSEVVALWEDSNGFVRVSGGDPQSKGLILNTAEADRLNADNGGGEVIALQATSQSGPEEYFQIQTGGVYDKAATLLALKALEDPATTTTAPPTTAP